MKIRKGLQRLLSVFLAVLMVFSVIPASVQAEGTETYQKISSAGEFTSGSYVMVTGDNIAVGALDNNWVLAVPVSPENDTVVNPEGAVVEITVEGDSAKLQVSNGSYIAPKGGNNNGITEGEYSWSWSESNGKFTFSGTSGDTVTLASNKGTENKFRAYKTATIAGNPSGYPSEFTLYKLTESGTESGGGTETVVAAPTAEPQAGEVASGTEITLTTTTAGAQIYYTLDESEPGTGSTLYSDDNKPVITENCTLKAVTVLGEDFSAIQELQYTVKEDSGTRSADSRRRTGGNLCSGI